MKNAKIVLVAEWSGWCGSCSAERPLVLTRTGPRSLRAWLSASSHPQELLTLTCRLCGVGSVVPPQDDDPDVLQPSPLQGAPVEVVPGLAEAQPVPTVDLAVPAQPSAAEGRSTGLGAHPGSAPAETGEDMHQARRLVGAGLAALLAQRTAEADKPGVQPVPAVMLAPLPLQRRSPDEGGLGGMEALQLLAEGIDLLDASRP